MAAAGVVEDQRAVDPIAYIRALGLRPEDSYGFLPLDIQEASSFLFLYRDRPEYEQARVQLPGAESIQSVDLGVVGFDMGTGRQMDVDMPAEKPGGRTGDLIAQALEMQKAYGAPAHGSPEASAAQVDSVEKLKAAGVIDDAAYQQMLYGAQGGHAGPAPGGVQAAAAAHNAPPIVVHRIYPRLYKRSMGDQLDFFMPRYRDVLGLCSEDVYGVFPRHIQAVARGETRNTINVWDDYWIIYRDRSEYAQGREAWANEMNEPGGWTEKMFSSMMKGSWPDAEVVPGITEPSTAAFDGNAVEVQKDGWPREMLVVREKGSELGEALREKVARRGYEPEDSLGFCPDPNANSIYFAWRKR